MTETPLVAICIPVYEKLNLFKRVMESIREQTYDRYIIVVTDDSATSDIEDFVNNISDEKIKYYHNEYSLGASENTNRSIRYAIRHNADIIKILFQDDWFTYHDSLEKMVRKLIDSDADILFAGNIEAYPYREREHICSASQLKEIKNDISCLYRSNFLGAPSNIMYRTSDIFFDSTYTWLLDVDFYLRFLVGKRMEYIQEPLITIGHDGDQLTDFFMKNYPIVLKETLSLYKKNKNVHTCKNRLYVIKMVWMCIKQVIRKSMPFYRKMQNKIWNALDHAEEIAIFGAGEYMHDFFKRYGEKYRPCMIVDNAKEKWGKRIYEIEVQPPEVLSEQSNLTVLICCAHTNEIKKQLDRMGIKNYVEYKKD